MNYRSHFGLCPFEDHHTKKMEEEKPEKKTNCLKAPGTEVRTEILSVSFKLWIPT